MKKARSDRARAFSREHFSVSFQKCGFLVLIKAAQAFAVRRTRIRRSPIPDQNLRFLGQNSFGESMQKHLNGRIFVRDQGEAENQTAGILMYVEDLSRGLNADIGRKDIFEIASNFFP